ncbi:MAG: tetratricopeptide repeat protein [Desulfovibrio sp.]|jgi:tetratricopeptide (TPR) repeat protein|nr:tetratricopeptide repeat protein [Desulfovibrio sp.]
MPARQRKKAGVSFLFLQTLLVLVLALAGGLAACRDGEQAVRDDIALAEDALNRRDLDDAAMYFERYLRKNPNGLRRWQVWQQLLGIALDLRQDKATARAYLEIMLEEFEADTEKRRSLQLLLARICRETHDYGRAAVLWEALIQDPQTPDNVKAGVSIDLSKAYLRRLEFTLATDTLVMCTRLRVDIALKADCLYALGETQVLTENLETAEATLRAAISLEAIPEDRRVLAVFLLADVLEQRGQYAGAIDLFTGIRASYPNERVVEMRLFRLKNMKK